MELSKANHIHYIGHKNKISSGNRTKTRGLFLKYFSEVKKKNGNCTLKNLCVSKIICYNTVTEHLINIIIWASRQWNKEKENCINIRSSTTLLTRRKWTNIFNISQEIICETRTFKFKRHKITFSLLKSRKNYYQRVVM